MHKIRGCHKRHPQLGNCPLQIFWGQRGECSSDADIRTFCCKKLSFFVSYSVSVRAWGRRVEKLETVRTRTFWMLKFAVNIWFLFLTKCRQLTEDVAAIIMTSNANPDPTAKRRRFLDLFFCVIWPKQ